MTLPVYTTIDGRDRTPWTLLELAEAVQDNAADLSQDELRRVGELAPGHQLQLASGIWIERHAHGCSCDSMVGWDAACPLFRKHLEDADIECTCYEAHPGHEPGCPRGAL